MLTIFLIGGVLAGLQLLSASQEQISVQIVGNQQTVLDWTTKHCSNGGSNDAPDLPAKAFKDHNGKTVVIASNRNTRLLIGDSLNTVHRQNCNIAMSSGNNSDPAQYNHQEWMNTLYTEDGKNVYGVVHNEFHAEYLYPELCSTKDVNKCWMVSLTLAKSTDGGRSFTQSSAPNHFIGTAPYRYVKDGGRVGPYMASNIIKKDNFYYMLIQNGKYKDQERGTCIARTNDLNNPKTWRMWDGAGYKINFIDPYRSKSDPKNHVCKPVATKEISNIADSLTYNTYLKKYIIVGESIYGYAGEKEEGIYYSSSSDLINWSPKKILWKTKIFHTWAAGDQNPIGYPSLIDPTSSTRNYETTGQRPYLYFTRMNWAGGNKQDRDLVRIQIEFTKESDEPPGGGGGTPSPKSEAPPPTKADAKYVEDTSTTESTQINANGVANTSDENKSALQKPGPIASVKRTIDRAENAVRDGEESFMSLSRITRFGIVVAATLTLGVIAYLTWDYIKTTVFIRRVAHHAR